MHVKAVLYKAPSHWPMSGVHFAHAAVFLLSTALFPASLHASSPAADPVDSKLLVDLEQRALAANVREQAFLYADLADKMSLLAGKQLAEGEEEAAEATLARMEACTAKMQSNLKDSKSLKKTELLLHMTNRRLTDMVRASGMDAKPHVQSALKRLNAAQTSLLTLIFAK